jgi:hypothetical protein
LQPVQVARRRSGTTKLGWIVVARVNASEQVIFWDVVIEAEIVKSCAGAVCIPIIVPLLQSNTRRESRRPTPFNRRLNQQYPPQAAAPAKRIWSGKHHSRRRAIYRNLILSMTEMHRCAKKPDGLGCGTRSCVDPSGPDWTCMVLLGGDAKSSKRSGRLRFRGGTDNPMTILQMFVKLNESVDALLGDT